MIKVVEFEQETKYIEEFLRLPSILYDKKTITQNYEEEKSLLLDKHVLSKYFKLHKYLVYSKSKVAGRCIITIYPNDPTLYIGYFECINDAEVSASLFKKVEEYAKKNKFGKIVGPVDCSFWIKYRLKTNQFDKRPYIGEPYNKEYYLSLFSDYDFKISENYISNIFHRLPLFNKKINKKKYVDRYKEFSKKEYKIISPRKKDYDKVFKEIYQMLMELYNDFPLFKYITEEDFIKHFSYFKYITDPSMLKMAYHNGEAVGFFIGVPDYHNMLYSKLNMYKYLKIFIKRIRSSNYVMLYMGVKKEHQGLGKAITNLIIKNVVLRMASAIGAFIRKGKITEKYVSDAITDQYEYVLLEKVVKE
jgi:hypothetical protein